MGFGDRLKAAGQQVDNHPGALATKIALRRRLVDAIGPAECRVFDAFAGEGHMHRAAWHDVADYVGCDQRWKTSFDHKSYCADNRRVLRRLNLDRFNVFDLDAYGSPYEQVAIIAARRQLGRGERIGIALTDGGIQRAKLGLVPYAMAYLAGVTPRMRGAATEWEALTARALCAAAARMGGRVEGLWQAE